MKHKDASFLLSTPHHNRLSAACQFNIASLQCSGTVPTGKDQENLVQEFYEEQFNNPSRTFHKQYYKLSFLFISRNGEKSRGKGTVIMSQISKSISWTSARPWIFSKLIDHQVLTLYICITLEIIKLSGVFCYLKERLCGHNALRGPVPFQNYFEFIKWNKIIFCVYALLRPSKKLKGLCIVLLVLIRKNGDIFPC